jgi:hypothetical protein
MVNEQPEGNRGGSVRTGFRFSDWADAHGERGDKQLDILQNV